MSYLLEGLAQRHQTLQAEIEGVEILQRLVRGANLSHEDETRLALAVNGIHPAIISKRLGDEAKAKTVSD